MSENDDYLSISQFSEIINISRKTLIYYDNIGLLEPEYTAQNGYRYYTRDQIDRVTAIKILSELGVPLKDMNDYLEKRDIHAAEALLIQKQDDVEAQIQYLHFVKEMIDRRLELLVEGSTVDYMLSNANLHNLSYSSYQLVKQPQEISIYMMASGTSRSNPPDHIRTEYYRTLSQSGIPFGFPFGYIIAKEDLLNANFDSSHAIFFRLKRRRFGNAFMPKGEYLVSYRHADYGKTHDLFVEMVEYAHENNLKIIGDAYEEYEIDELATVDTEKYLVRISVLIERVEP